MAPNLSRVLSYITAPRRWAWGGLGGEDCTTFAASWVEEVCGTDPAAALRGTYSTKEEANLIVERAGGVGVLMAFCLDPIGLRRIQQPQDGDVGVVIAMTGFDADGAVVKEIPGIRFGPNWAVMSARGPMVKRLDWTGVAWRVL